jgi:hypothetical protein
VIDVRASPAEKVYRSQTNDWRRARFGKFPHRPGDRLPPGTPGAAGTPRNHLQAFFETPAEAEHERRAVHLQSELQRRGSVAYEGTTAMDWKLPSIPHIPAFHRVRLVTGADQCYECDGIGWLLHVPPGPPVLAERPCPLCGGSGSWKQAEARSGHPASDLHPIPAGFRGPAPGGPIPGSTPYLQAQRTAAPRFQNSPRQARTLVASFLFTALACGVAQAVHLVTGSVVIAALVALLLGSALIPLVARALFGPLQDGQVFGPLWILLMPLYALGGLLSFGATLARSDMLKSMAGQTFTTAASARRALGRLKVGR